MTKQEFLHRLEEGLAGLPQEDLAERLSFYSEMIDDRMEEGLSEEEAVAGIGPVVEIAAPAGEALQAEGRPEASAQSLTGQLPMVQQTAGRQELSPQQKQKRSTGEILLLILGFPLWFPLLIAAMAVSFVLILSLWVLVLSLWAANIAVIVSAVGGLVLGVSYLLRGETMPGLAVIGAGLALCGIAVFWYYGCQALTKAARTLTQKTAAAVKKIFRRKEHAR